jgi:hypothetical protein
MLICCWCLNWSTPEDCPLPPSGGCKSVWRCLYTTEKSTAKRKERPAHQQEVSRVGQSACLRTWPQCKRYGYSICSCSMLKTVISATFKLVTTCVVFTPTVQDSLLNIRCLDRFVSSPVYSKWLSCSSPSKSTINGPKLFMVLMASVWESCLVVAREPATFVVCMTVHDVYPPVSKRDAHPCCRIYGNTVQGR